jgi:hypothetical protein
MYTNIKYSALLIVIALVSCEKEEAPIKPFTKSGVQVVSINTGVNGDYSKQIFYNLNANEVVRTIDRTIWDLGFESTPTGVNVILNSSNKMQAATTAYSDFHGFTSLSGMTLNYTWDHSSGLADSLALKLWLSSGSPTNKVFVIDRGEGPDATSRGLKKLQILSSTSTDYTIKYANINGSDEHTFVITKDPTKNNTCFSFNNGGSVVDVEPNKNDWDVLFTQYTYTFYVANPPLPYSVNGTLLNRGVCKAVKVFNKSFTDITINDIPSYSLNDTLDVIGYDWKYFDFDASQYSVYDYKNYLIQDRQGAYHKLRFIDFYNDQGIKGSPKFEIEKL